jgi:muramoyltetrapeptide carboxypeptidase
MLAQRLSKGAAGYDWSSFDKALCHPQPMGELRPDGLSVLKPGMGEGMLIGGTLTTIAAGLGTPYGIELDRPSILFLEDISERPYKLRRMLTQLKLAGVFDNVTGIVLGSMTGCDEPPSMPPAQADLTARDVVARFFADFDGPILAGFPSGHGPAPTWTLPFGVRSLISTRDGGSLLIEEAAVE